ncbi:hypothetical protein K470DRAFT_260319 [Piedraia hortae CBS 480.64]|uniref:Uncharacterized protein n=1 Tax=Piedraia hortae CBS 480.64 TaxID=1314780 RepID=A0A6A7BTY3_9PEZI|nr:hypothetical protein K470DRAFT_260319 [Piedraia hortae CBS 480.64]
MSDQEYISFLPQKKRKTAARVGRLLASPSEEEAEFDVKSMKKKRRAGMKTGIHFSSSITRELDRSDDMIPAASNKKSSPTGLELRFARSAGISAPEQMLDKPAPLDSSETVSKTFHIEQPDKNIVEVDEKTERVKITPIPRSTKGITTRRRHRKINSLIDEVSDGGVKTSELIDEIFRESINLPVYTRQKATSSDDEGQRVEGEEEGENDNDAAAARAFKREFLRSSEKHRRKAEPDKGQKAVGDREVHPKLGGSRSQRIKMRKEMDKK